MGQAYVQGAAWRWGPSALAQPGEEARAAAGHGRKPAHISWQTRPSPFLPSTLQQMLGAELKQEDLGTVDMESGVSARCHHAGDGEVLTTVKSMLFRAEILQ